MIFSALSPRRAAPRAFTAIVLLAGLTLSACSPAPAVSRADIHDPYESRNREMHQLNKDLDRAVLRPIGVAYATVLPGEVQTMVGNLGDNLAEPSHFVNHMLQGNARGMGVNLARFLINSTIGLGGLIDAASEFGIVEDDSDFGETLHVWGASEGPYVELPLLGPSTQRDAIGRMVDLFTDPLSPLLPEPEKYIGTTARLADKLGSRGRYVDTVDSLLYDSADSYAQARLLYLQNRRFELGIDSEDTYIDPEEIDTEGF